MLNSLSVRNFRNLEIPHQNFPFGTTILVGNNGQGKTAILEALYFLSYGKTFRGTKGDSVNWYEDEAQITGKTDKETLTVVFGKTRETQVLVNNKRKNTAELIGRFISVLFHPSEIEIVTGPPQLRRAWLDRVILTTDKKYLFNLVNYHKALKGRNRLLKMGRSGTEEVKAWDKNLASFGSRVWARRREVCEETNKIMSRESKRVVGKPIRISYANPIISNNPAEEERIFLKGLLNTSSLEERLLVTLFGPHRDDFKLVSEETRGQTLIEKNVAAFGSRGEQRQATILLKLTEAGFFYQIFKKAPTILLDDVTSELDETNRDLLLTNLVGGQVIVTTTSLEVVPPKLKRRATVFEVKEGKIIPT
jgi:DNA replication and repair protein RecF